MTVFSFTKMNHPEWDKKIATGLRKECKVLTNSTERFKTHPIYAKRGNTFVGGIIIEQYGYGFSLEIWS